MEPLGALPERREARLAVARADEEASELGQVPHPLAERGRSLRWGAVLWPGLPRGTRRVPVGDTPMAVRAHEAFRPVSRQTLPRLQKPRVHLPVPIRHSHDERLWTARAGPRTPADPLPPTGNSLLLQGGGGGAPVPPAAPPAATSAAPSPPGACAQGERPRGDGVETPHGP
jgi:hypothetical protein